MKDNEIIEYEIEKLTEYENNPRNNDDAVEDVARAIERFGFRVPIVIQSDGKIIDGHLRVKSAKHLGMETVPAIVVNDMTPEQIRAFRISVNGMSQLADWNLDKLKEELNMLIGSEDLDALGFTDTELDQLLADTSIFDEAEEEVELQKTGEEIPKMERMLNEHNDYIVFVFRNTLDYLQAVERLGIKKVDSSLSPKTKKIGAGRVLDGHRLVELFGEGK